MPCMDSNYGRADDSRRLQATVDNLTNLLCALCRTVEAEQMSPELKAWWGRHVVDDLARNQRDRERARDRLFELRRNRDMIDKQISDLEGERS